MEKYLKDNIKDVLTQFPALKPVLEEFGIHCASCAAGTCALGQIVEMHPLSEDDETRMMTRIGAILSPDRPFLIPRRIAPRIDPAQSKQVSPPLRMLVEEHRVIKRLLALLPSLLEAPVPATDEWIDTIGKALEFIRSYADRFHHAKEEDILFRFFDPNLDIVNAMLVDHETGRLHVAAARTAITQRDVGGITAPLNAYRELLMEHIRKEDDILYPWMDARLSDAQVGQLFSASLAIRDNPDTRAEFFEAWVDTLEKISFVGVA